MFCFKEKKTLVENLGFDQHLKVKEIPKKNRQLLMFISSLKHPVAGCLLYQRTLGISTFCHLLLAVALILLEFSVSFSYGQSTGKCGGDSSCVF